MATILAHAALSAGVGRAALGGSWPARVCIPGRFAWVGPYIYAETITVLPPAGKPS